MEQGTVPMADMGDAEHVLVADRHVIAHELAERSLRPADMRQDLALDHDLGVGRHHQVDGFAGAHLHRPAADLGCRRQLVGLDRQRGGGGKEDIGRCPDQECRRQRLAVGLGLGLVAGQVMRGAEPDAQLLVADIHRAVE